MKEKNRIIIGNMLQALLLGIICVFVIAIFMTLTFEEYEPDMWTSLIIGSIAAISGVLKSPIYD